MIVTLVIAIIIIGVTLNQYLSGTVLKSTLMLIASICGMILAFTYYEILAGFALSKGYGAGWALTGSLAIVFMISFAVIYAAFSALTSADIHFSHLPDKAIVCVCAGITAMIFCGVILTALSMSPIPSKWLYSRYDSENFQLNSPSGILIPVDTTVAGLFNALSNGSMKSNKSFAVMHPNFIDQIHLNKLHSSEGVSSIAAPDCLIVKKNGLWKPTEKYKDAATGETIDREIVIVRTGIKFGTIEDGGATDEEGNFIFTLAQFQMIAVDGSIAASDKKFGASSAVTVYPIGYVKTKGVVEQKQDISQPITMGRSDFMQHEDYGNVLLIDLVFEQPRNGTPITMNFRNNVTVELPKATEEDQVSGSTVFIQKTACTSDAADVASVSGTKIKPLQITAGDKFMMGLLINTSMSQLLKYEYSSTDAEPQMDNDKIYNAKLKFRPAALDIQTTDNERVNQSSVPNLLSEITGYTLVALKCQMASASAVDSQEFPVLVDTQGREHNAAGLLAGGTKGSENIYQLDYCSDQAMLSFENERITKPFTSQLWLGGETDKINELYFFYYIPSSPEGTIIIFVRTNGKDAGITKYEGFLCEN